MLDEDVRQPEHLGQRWRVAFTAIRFATLLVNLSNNTPENDSLPRLPRQPKHRGQRWRVAFTAIRFTTLPVHLSNKIPENNSLPCATIDILDDDAPPGEVHASMPSIDPKTLIDMVQEKSMGLLNRLGGAEQVAAILASNVKEGLLAAAEVDLEHRRQLFGANRCKKQQPVKGFAMLFLQPLKEKTLIILFVCAVMSLAFGIKQHGPKDGCYDGASNIIGVFLAVIVSSMTKFILSSQFRRVSYEMNRIKVQVIRGGRHFSVSIYDLVVGDVACLRAGDQVPADGLLLEGYSLKVDESSLRSGDGRQVVGVNTTTKPFLLSGSKVIGGYGSMLVTSVGMNTTWGKIMSSRNDDFFLDEQQAPIQAYLNKLTSRISKAGLAVAMVVSMILWFNHREKNIVHMVEAIVGFIDKAVTIVVLAIPEGLPPAATLTLAYYMMQMMKKNVMVLKPAACETMASATTICTDKTGTLTLNQLKVVEFWLGKEAIEFNASMEVAPEVYVLLQEGIALNTTGTVDKRPISSPNVSGSPTEKAILSWAVLDMGMDINQAKETCEIIDMEVSIHPERRRSGVLLVRKGSENEIHTHWRGDAEMILGMCSSYYIKTGAEKEMDEEGKLRFENIIQSMAAKGLSCIAFAHKRVTRANGNVSEKLEETRLSLLGLFGMKDPLRHGIRTAIESCKNAGVNVKMVTGDNIYTARATAIECGILDPEQDIEATGVLMEGVQFRNYSSEERMERVDNIRVMARSSPSDKLLMVQCLKAKGHVVAITGDGVDDASALKEAHIGFSTRTRGIEVMKESSDILIEDGNFASVVRVLRWTRCVFNNIQKFIQFQLTVNIAAFVFNFIAAVSSGETPLTSFQQLWVNILVDILGVFTFSTSHPSDELMSRPPVARSQPLISYIIWKNVAVHAVLQLFILLTVQFKGRAVFGWDKNLKNTLIFNIFALCQVFGLFNARVVFMKNMFKLLLENKLFAAVMAATILVHVLIVEFPNKIANTEKLEWKQWCACIVIAALSWVIARIVQ